MLLNHSVWLLGLFALHFASSLSNKTVIKNYVLDTKACRIPNLFQWDFDKFRTSKSYVPCGIETAVVTVENIDGRFFAVVNPSVVSYYRRNSTEISCWINNVTRGLMTDVPDNEIRSSKPVPFETVTKAEVTNDVVKVKCYKVDKNDTSMIYENVFGTYVPFNIMDQRRPLAQEPFNVLMLAIDSLSKFNMVRLMPMTYKYLIQKDYMLLHGFSQLDRVALPNIVPMLTGYSMPDALAKFGSPLDTFFDIYDFLWYDFAKYGYVTAFAEDFAQVNTFNRQYKGFWSKPTDFYFRPLILAVDTLNSTSLDYMPHCTGPENEAERILNLASGLTTSITNRPYLGLFWLNSFSHDDYNGPGRMDAKIKEFFETIEPYLEKTFVIFFSDHGYSKDTIAEDPLGWYESISPFMFVYLPPSFRKKYPEMAEEFRENSNNLVSPYDIYATLQDILVLSEANHSPKKPKSCPKCRSLLRKVTKNRTCRDVGVDEEFCICWKEGMLRTSSDVKTEKPVKQTEEEGSVRHGRGTRLYNKSISLVLVCFYTITMYSLMI